MKQEGLRIKGDKSGTRRRKRDPLSSHWSIDIGYHRLFILPKEMRKRGARKSPFRNPARDPNKTGKGAGVKTRVILSGNNYEHTIEVYFSAIW